MMQCVNGKEFRVVDVHQSLAQNPVRSQNRWHSRVELDACRRSECMSVGNRNSLPENTPFRLAVSERTRPLFISCPLVDEICLMYLDVFCD